MPAGRLRQAPRRNFIDEHVLAKLQALSVPPSPTCDDATFLRRAYLDTIGTLPTADEARAFLADDSADKRDRLIDQLLGRPEFVDYWAYKWSDLLLLSGERLRPEGDRRRITVDSRAASRQNKPWDEFVREIVTATGSTHENGAANFYALHQDPEEMAETVAQAFMGLSINCAKCHNHPLEKWTNDQYYAFANMFSRVRAKGWGGDYPQRRRPAGRLFRHAGRADPAQPRHAAAAAPARWPAAAVRGDRRPPAGRRRVAHVAGESVLHAGHRQPRLGQLLRRRPGRSGR